MSSESKIDLHRAHIQDLVGKVREPLEEEFEDEEEEMRGDLDNLQGPKPSKKPKKTIVAPARGTPSQAKRAPVNTETDAAELKKQRLVLGLGSGKDARKDKTVAEKSSPEKAPVEEEAPSKGVNAEASSPTPFTFAPQIKQGQPVLISVSVRANPRLGLPVL